MRFTLTKMTTALVILAAASGVAYAQNYKGEYKGEPVVATRPVPCVVPCQLKDGFYVGGQVGYDAYRVRESLTTAGGALAVNPQISANGWVGGLMVGYGQYLNDAFYLGAEVFGNYSDADAGFSATATAPGATVAFNNSIRVRGSWGVAVLPGVRLNDGALGYVRLGYNWANIRTSDSITGIPGSPGVNKSHTSSGFNFGVGIEALMYENWSVRAEYTHTNYSSFTSNFGASNTKYSPSDNQFMLGAIYHFAC